MTLSAEQFEIVRHLLEEHAGIALEPDQRGFVADRLLPVAQRRDWAGLDALIARLNSACEPTLLQAVIESLVIHETSFFRDAHYFSELAERVLPQLIARRLSTRRLAIWCAACSSGQEIYSIAMLLRERFSDQLSDWNVQLWATDISSRAIERAQAGRYSEVEVRRGLTDPRLAQHFRGEQGGWQINAELQQQIRFQRLNLLADIPKMGSFDLVLLRNVLIYMTPAARTTILARIERMMPADGQLMLGSTEVTYAGDVTVACIRSPASHSRDAT